MIRNMMKNLSMQTKQNKLNSNTNIFIKIQIYDGECHRFVLYDLYFGLEDGYTHLLKINPFKLSSWKGYFSIIKFHAPYSE